MLFQRGNCCWLSWRAVASASSIAAGGRDQPSHGKLLGERCRRHSCDATAKSFLQHHRDQLQQQQQHHPELRGIPAGAPGVPGCSTQHVSWPPTTPGERWHGYLCEILAEESSHFIPQIEPNEYFCSQTFRVLLLTGKRQIEWLHGH